MPSTSVARRQFVTAITTHSFVLPLLLLLLLLLLLEFVLLLWWWLWLVLVVAARKRLVVRIGVHVKVPFSANSKWMGHRENDGLVVTNWEGVKGRGEEEEEEEEGC